MKTFKLNSEAENFDFDLLSVGKIELSDIVNNDTHNGNVYVDPIICEKSNLTITVDMTAKQVTTNGMSKDGTVEFSECGLENEEESEIQDFFIERYEEDFNITVKFQ